MKTWPRLGSACLGLFASAALAHDGPAFSASVLVDGAPVPEYASRGRTYIEALKGKEFTIRLSNPTAERIAVALSVDGRNVVDAKRTSELAASKWVLGPGQTVEIPGWQVSGETTRKFFFTETSRSYAKWLGDTSNVGTIEAVFFRERVRVPAFTSRSEPLARNQADSSGEPVPPASERSAAGPSAAAPQPKTRVADEYAATGIGDKTAFSVRWVDFDEDPTPAARIAIRYEFRPQLVQLGILPRTDDALRARDHARGFEHDYAPDPYGYR
jgi:hypothetical protein